MSASFSISANDLWNLIGSGHAPRIIDTRRRAVYEQAPGMLPGATWYDPEKAAEWMGALDRSRPIVVACKAGHELSQMIAADLRGQGVTASILTDGYAAWTKAGLPVVAKAALDRFAPQAPKPVGHAPAAEDRPHRLPVADPPLPRSGRAHSVRRSAGSAGGRARDRRHSLRYRRRGNLA